MTLVLSDIRKLNLNDRSRISDFCSSSDGDFYDLLGIPDKRRIATEREIQIACFPFSISDRKKSLRFHPDKAKQCSDSEKAKIHSLYVEIQTAFETLIDSTKRRIYDSKLSFDDSLPETSLVPKENFFPTFYPVFERNSVFSVIKPVPLLGDENTHIDQVFRFYKFWRRFKTWRDYSFKAKHKLEQAENREERRWMARENQAEISKLEKAEAKRIKKLVNDAFKSDPRIELYYKKEAENKKLKKLKKLEKKKEREKEEKRIEELQEEARKRDFDKKAKAKELEAIINNKILKLKSDFRKLTELHKINAKMANRIFTKTKSAELQKILDSNCGEYELYLVHSKLITKEIESMSTDWSDDEIVLLTKAFKRHPAGTIDRWGKISRHLEKSGVAKSESDIILKSAKLTGKDNLPRKLRSKSLSRYEEGPKWSSEQHFLLEKGIALTANVKCAKSRWTRIAAMIPRKSPKDCVDEFKRIRTSLLDKPR